MAGFRVEIPTEAALDQKLIKNVTFQTETSVVTTCVHAPGTR
jgi:hypothetical protein